MTSTRTHLVSPEVQNYYDSLSTQDRIIFLSLLEEKQKYKTLISKPEPIRSLIPADQWMQDEYYVGKKGLSLYPYWQDFIRQLFTNNSVEEIQKNGISKYNELIIEGGLGTGKTTFATLVNLRFLYEMSCFKNVPGLFGLAFGTGVSLMYFSINLSTARRSGFFDLRQLIDGAPYFNENFKRNNNIQSEIRLPEDIRIFFGSTVDHQISLNLIGTIIDEANFFKTAKAKKVDPNESSKIAHLHSSLVNRQSSRFSELSRNDSLSVLISSPGTFSSYTEDRIQKSKTNDKCLCCKPRLWDVKPNKYPKERFFVFVGSRRLDPQIISNTYDLDVIKQAILPVDDFQSFPQTDPSLSLIEAIDQAPPEVKESIDQVPVNLIQNYKNDIYSSVRDFSAYSIAAKGRLFSSKEYFYKAVDQSLPEIFFKNQFSISSARVGQPDNTIQFYLRSAFINQLVPRYIHIDQSLSSDATGFGCCHIDPQSPDPNHPRIVVDFALQILPPIDGSQIDIEEVRKFIYYIRDTLQIPIGKVSYDQFQSSEALQNLQKSGIHAVKQSVEKDTPYLNLIRLFFSNRIRIPKTASDLMAEEIFELIHYRETRTVDHPDNKSKDVCDAIVGAVNNALSDFEVRKGNDQRNDIKVLLRANASDTAPIPNPFFGGGRRRRIL